MEKPPLPTQSPADLELAYKFFNEIGIIAQLATNQMQRRLTDGLTSSQFSVLNWFVRVDDQATPGRLAKAFQVTNGAMTNTLRKLANKKFVSIEPDPASGRRKIIRLTPAGRGARDRAVAATFPELQSFLDAFDASVLTEAMPLLARVRQFLDAARD